MASRTGINICTSNYFVAVRNCINIVALYGLEVLHRHMPYMRTTYIYVRNFLFTNSISVDLFVYRRST